MKIAQEFDTNQKRTLLFIVCDRCSARRQYNSRKYRTTLCTDCRKCLTPEQQRAWAVTEADMKSALSRVSVGWMPTARLNPSYRKMAA